MKHVVENGNVFSTVKFDLAAGETVKADAGAMISMDECIEIKAKTQGKGLGGIVKAKFSGESMFVTEATAVGKAGEIVFAPSSPGEIKTFDMKGNTIFCKGGSFLAGDPTLDISAQGSMKALFSGTGLFLQKITGTGQCAINSYGAIYEKDIKAGESYVIDTGHLLAFEETVTYSIKKASKGVFSTLASGEGLVCTMSGQGKVWIQTRNIQALANILSPFLGGQSSGNSGGGVLGGLLS